MNCFIRKNNGMDLNELRIFSRVAELASFTRAAEELGMAKGRVCLLYTSDAADE